MRKLLIIGLLASTKATDNAIASGNDAASLLQAHDTGSPHAIDAQRLTAKEAAGETFEDPAPLLAGVAVHSNNERRRQETGDTSKAGLWASMFAGEELLQKEWMANSSGESPGVLRMVSREVAEHPWGKKSHKAHKTIWIPAQPRSGSTLLMDMLSAPVTFSEDSKGPAPGWKFVLFEPCHGGDYANGVEWNNAQDRTDLCGQMIENIARCDFDDIGHISGWERRQSKGLPQPYSKDAGTFSCSYADLVLFKTVFLPPNPWNTFVRPRLEHVPSLHAVVNVRDPRSVLASQLRVFEGNKHIAFTATLKGICQSYASYRGVSHPRLLVVKFEAMIRNPWETMSRMYDFLGLEYGQHQQDWIWHRFGDGPRALNCSRGEDVRNQNYTTCQRDVEKTINKWRDELTEEHLRDWPSQACRRVAERFDYK